jgi:hypothetical protein
MQEAVFWNMVNGWFSSPERVDPVVVMVVKVLNK